MRLARVLLGLWLSCVAVAMPCSATPARSTVPVKSNAAVVPQVVPGYVLEQNSQIYGSGIVFKICKSGFAWSIPANGVTVMAAAPAWRVYVYNAQTRRYFETSLDKYEGYMLRASIIFWGFSFPRIPYEEKPSQILAGHMCRVFDMKKVSVDEKLKLGIDTLRDSRLITVKDLDVAPQVAVFVRKQLNFPVLGDLPVSMCVERKDREQQFMLKTKKVTPVKINLSDFTLPAGAKRALNDKEVLRGAAEESSLDGLLRDIDRKEF